jgi:Transposase
MASLEVLAGPERRRRWSVEQKQAIVAAAFKPGAVVRDVARRADVTSSLIYRWRMDLLRCPRRGRSGHRDEEFWLGSYRKFLTLFHYSAILLLLL